MAAYASPFQVPAGPTGSAGPKPGPSARLAIVLIVIGLVVGIPTFVLGLVPIIRNLTSAPQFDAPGHVQLRLGSGKYLVYQQTGSGSFDFNAGDVTMTPSEITVTSESGENIPVSDPGTARQTITQNGRRFTGAAEFTTPAAGLYLIAITSPGATRVVIARPLLDTMEKSLGWFALSGIAGITFVVGVVLLIVGSVRRGRVRNQFAYAAQAVPPGWYPDPGGSTQQRYWDGARWTEHLH